MVEMAWFARFPVWRTVAGRAGSLSLHERDRFPRSRTVRQNRQPLQAEGFRFQSAEIYGGFRSTYDYGPLGVLLLRNVKDAWWRSMVQERHDVVGLDASILSPPQVWQASGHLANFSDPLVDCTNCNARHRLDKLDDPNVCPTCGSEGTFTEAREFNLMFKTHAGPVTETAAEVYLRPETAQGMFINFANVLNTSRKRPPFGIAQIGKSFRNEITPGNFVFRTREFEQMEMEFFVPPAESQEWYEYWCQTRMDWYLDLGMDPAKIKLRAHDDDELSHYSSGTSDVEYLFPWGWDELEGIANRGDFDLTQHATHSGEKLDFFDQANNERYVPHVIEPAAGATRTAMAFLMDAYDEEVVNDDTRTVLRLDHRLRRTKSPCCRCRRRTPSRRQRWRSSIRSSVDGWSTTTRRSRSASATPARTRSARRTVSRSISTRSMIVRSRFVNEIPVSRIVSRSTNSRGISPSG